MVREYIGARYVPKFLGTYDPTQVYEALCVVDNGSGTSYISKVPTPAGTPLTDTTYWTIYGAASGAIINLQNQIDDINNVTIPAITNDVDTIENTTIPAIQGDVSTLQGNVNTLTNTTIPAIENDIDNIIANMVEVSEGPHVYSGSADCSDNAIHVVASFELEADKLYYVFTSCQFEIAANSANGEHWLEMEVGTNPTPSAFGRPRLYWVGDITQYVTNTDTRSAQISNAFVIKPATNTTYYLYVRDYKSASATVHAYPCVQAVNFD